MLSVQPVNFSVNRIPFKGAEDPTKDENYIYSKEQYETDKTKIEESLEAVNEIVENAGNSKSVRVIGKLASIGIGAALGFVSLKFGAQGVAKLAKKGFAAVKNFVTKPEVKEAADKTADAAKKVVDESKGLFKRFIDWAKENKFVQKVVKFAKDMIAKVKDSKFGQKVSEFFKTASESKFGKKVAEIFSEAKGKVKVGAERVSEAAKNLVKPAEGTDVTPLEKGVVNLFAVSGGVSGGITALQEATKESK